MEIEAIEIIKAIALLMIFVPISIVVAVLVVGIPTLIYIFIQELFYHLKEKYYD